MGKASCRTYGRRSTQLENGGVRSGIQKERSYSDRNLSAPGDLHSFISPSTSLKRIASVSGICPISRRPSSGSIRVRAEARASVFVADEPITVRSEEHTSELQSRGHLVCRLL